MTPHTEAERAEFERTVADEIYGGLIELISDHWDSVKGEYKLFQHQVAWIAWQAARRAPAVPVPQKGWRYVPEVLTPEMKREFMDMLMDGIDIYMNSNDQIEIQTDAPRRIWKSILAAAPQPPEAAKSNSAEFDGIEKAAAPVQLPEPEFYADDRGYEVSAEWLASDDATSDYREVYTIPRYTEQQVRELLANHGIQERST